MTATASQLDTHAIRTERHDKSALLTELRKAGADVSRPEKIRCPFHDDANPSAGVYQNGSGAWRFHCHGCGHDADVFDLRAQRESKPLRDVLPSNGNAAHIVAEYNYVDEHGAVVYQAVRFDPKDFRQRQPDGNGGWRWKMNGVQRIPYQLPRIIQATPDSFIYMVEGEKDADRLTHEGMIATTTVGGAGKGKYTNLGALHGRHIVILPDNDNQGREHAQDVAQRLHGKAASVRIVELPNLPGKGDVSDWLDAGNDPEDLWRLAEETPVYDGKRFEHAGKAMEHCAEQREATAKRTHGSHSDEPVAPRLSMRRLDGVEPETIEWLWPHRFPLRKLSILAGTQGEGKSFLTLDMAARISTATPWPDAHDHPNPAGSVVLLSLEDGIADTVVPRLRNAGADLSRIHAIDGVNDPDSNGIRAFDAIRDVQMLTEEIERLGDVRLIVIDPLMAFVGAKTNTDRENDVRAALDPLVRLAERHDAALLGVMHLRKSQSDKALYRIMGSSAFTALARAVWMVGGDDENKPHGRLMLKAKLNLAKAAPGIGFEIVEPGQVRWGNTSDMEADDVLSEQHSERDAGPKVAEAMEFLQHALTDGAQPSTELRKRMKAEGISDRTIDRAKSRLGVKSEFSGIGEAWNWRLPVGSAPCA